ncbi:MAG: hypothetical protein C4293_12195 [Nitrospiraceae bacterium]
MVETHDLENLLQEDFLTVVSPRAVLQANSGNQIAGGRVKKRVLEPALEAVLPVRPSSNATPVLVTGEESSQPSMHRVRTAQRKQKNIHFLTHAETLKNPKHSVEIPVAGRAAK